MTRFAIHGAAGRMGRSIASVLIDDAAAELVSAMDRSQSEAAGRDMGELCGVAEIGVKVTDDLEALLERAQVVIDFSLPAATAHLLPVCAGQRVPVIVGTTGLDEDVKAVLHRAAERVPVVFAPNFSQGVTALFHLASRASALLGDSFDAEIVDIHHRNKIDAPSGTAVKLAEVVAQAKAIDLKDGVTHGRSGQVGVRPDKEIGVMTLRGGDVVGEHTLYLAGQGERLEITHRATDRMIFARGAVRAAHWAVGKPPGLYDMFDVMGVER